VGWEWRIAEMEGLGREREGGRAVDAIIDDDNDNDNDGDDDEHGRNDGTLAE
jgi:hypothetical protein